MLFFRSNKINHQYLEKKSVKKLFDRTEIPVIYSILLKINDLIP